MEQADFKFKIITAGDNNVGKTTMLIRYIEGKFLFDTKLTIGVDIFHKVLNLKNGIVCSLQLWDLGGQEKFRIIVDNFVKNSSGAFLMFDLTNKQSFNNLSEWEGLIRKNNPDLPIILIGSKFDLKDHIKVNDESALKFMKKNDISAFFKTSSMTGYNINVAFETLAKIIIKKIQEK